MESNAKNEITMDIDFLIRDGRNVIPIKVKSNDSFTVKPLKKVKAKFPNRIGLQYVLYEGDVKRERGILSIFFAAWPRCRETSGLRRSAV